MNKTGRKVAQLLAAGALLGFSQGLLALGLGNATVESYLNQPLRVEIELITREGDDVDSVRAGLASADDFALIGASLDAISVPLRFDIEREGDDVKIVVTSTEAVRDPIIRIIVEVNWSAGRMLREYTLFLDPPTLESAAPPPATEPQVSRPETQPEAEAMQETAEPARGPAPSAQLTGAEDEEYGPVQGGETLWRIATDWSRGSGLNVNQVMLAIQRNNPEAFINSNINLLKRGAILRMPRVDDVRSLTAQDAYAEVIEQGHAFSQGIAAPAVETPLVDAAAEDITETAGEVEAAEDQLEIVPPVEGVDAPVEAGEPGTQFADAEDTSARGLREELARAEEDLISQQQENEYLRDRIAELESRQDEAPEATVTDPELAAMEEDLRAKRLREGGFESAPAEGAGAAAPDPDAAGKATGQQAAPKVVRAPAREADTPWYASWTVWVIALLVIGAAVAGWLLSRRDRSTGLDLDATPAEDHTVREIETEAREILKVLEPGAKKISEPMLGDEADEAAEVGGTSAARLLVTDEEAAVLDEDSADPEVRLDLARAYISMGDREAARVVLDEVLQHGNKKQQTEARVMLAEL